MIRIFDLGEADASNAVITVLSGLRPGQQAITVSDLWILLDPAMGAEGGELTAQAARQLEAYRLFVKSRKQHIILNAANPPASREDVYAAIIDMLVQRTDNKFGNRF